MTPNNNQTCHSFYKAASVNANSSTSTLPSIFPRGSTERLSLGLEILGSHVESPEVIFGVSGHFSPHDANCYVAHARLALSPGRNPSGPLLLARHFWRGCHGTLAFVIWTTPKSLQTLMYPLNKWKWSANFQWFPNNCTIATGLEGRVYLYFTPDIHSFHKAVHHLKSTWKSNLLCPFKSSQYCRLSVSFLLPPCHLQITELCFPSPT